MILDIEAGVELKSCPFCGSDAVLRTDEFLAARDMPGAPATPAIRNHFWVKCANRVCGASPAAAKNEGVAIDAWNARA